MLCKYCLSDKPAEGFYANNKSRCKECVKAATRENYRKNIEHFKQYERQRASAPHRVLARKEYANTEAGKLRHREARLRYHERHPERRNAAVAVGNALRDGRLTRQPCHVCGQTAVEGHHPDYSRPLDVVWLCNQHHREAHEVTELEAA
jgi:hypothetical protein